MEQVLDAFLDTKYKYLGMPYWHWSSDKSKTYQHGSNIYPIFPDFWQDVKVAYKKPNHNSYDNAFAGEGAGWGQHCTTDRYLQDTIARAKVHTLVQERLSQSWSGPLTVNYLDGLVKEAMNQNGIVNFAEKLSNAHNPIHSEFGCRMYSIGKQMI